MRLLVYDWHFTKKLVGHLRTSNLADILLLTISDYFIAKIPISLYLITIPYTLSKAFGLYRHAMACNPGYKGF